MKFYLFIFIIVAVLVFSCSCSERYRPQENITLNYNNISASEMHCWIDKNAVYYLEHGFLSQPIYRVTKGGKDKIAESGGYVHAKVRNFEDNIYILDEDDFGSKFRKYSPEDDSLAYIALIKDGQDFFPAKDYIYFKTMDPLKEGDRDHSLKVMTLATEEMKDISSGVFASGMHGEDLVYLKTDHKTFSLYKYDTNTSESTLLGSFDIFEQTDMINSAVNFTSEYVMLNVSDREKLYIYNIADNKIETVTLDGTVSEIVAYDQYAFLLKGSTLCRLNLKTHEIDEIVELKGDCDLFVTSDEDCCVSSTSYDGYKIVHYDIEGKKTTVLS